MPSNFVLKTANQIHKTLMTVSGGRLGWSVANMPVVELTTTGRKSGQRRSTLLTTPWSDGDTMAIVASAGGNDQHPAWYLNLRDDPSVTVRTESGTREMTARVTEGDERADLWEQITSTYRNYADYQSKTDREIPVVLLEPVE
ncbi:MAG: nitroreductase family deazaflavin-dependent oxidoreductase [Ilumatobacter sp.]|uniref:nitroreductase family deazaflavin-dependent oxidoreductase n=1 Tax=Ilumatobacter sp. TaxID=1967498 RepID=UPI0026095A9D|nr:nitroreductase family deazaflavin-dependent oxidoreductase [Ilumatobacter sp.]MDJ0768959.1 nitroreductase family deazaflavin-dependent oxidoreductase [Ilumatobacter sp.]